MVIKPTDFLTRRTGDLYFDIKKVEQYKEAVIDTMANLLNYDNAQRTEYTRELEQKINEAKSPSVQVSVE